jgi:hypothetical protein
MKNFKLTLSLFVFTLVFASCTTNENLIEDSAATLNLLESYTLSKNESGIYAMDYTISDKATSQLIRNKKDNTNDFYLYSSSNQAQKYYNEEFSITNNELNIGFIDTNSPNQSSIKVIDDNIVFAKGDENDGLLNSYSITKNENKTYDLSFSVNKDVEVDFVFNEELDIYEIHLLKNKGTQVDFTKTFTKKAGNALRIDFVNHKNSAAKGYAFKEAATKRKPRLIIDSIE